MTCKFPPGACIVGQPIELIERLTTDIPHGPDGYDGRGVMVVAADPNHNDFRGYHAVMLPGDPALRYGGVDRPLWGFYYHHAQARYTSNGILTAWRTLWDRKL